MKLAFALVLAATALAHADDTTLQATASPRTIGVDAAVVVPMGAYGNAVSYGAGAFGRLEFPVSTGGFVSGRIGLIAHRVDQSFRDAMDTSLLLIPVYAGYRHPLGTGGAYIAGELGLTFWQATAEASRFGRISGSETELGMSITAGIRRGALDFRAGLFAPQLDDVHGFMASLGYDFAAF